MRHIFVSDGCLRSSQNLFICIRLSKCLCNFFLMSIFHSFLNLINYSERCHIFSGVTRTFKNIQNVNFFFSKNPKTFDFFLNQFLEFYTLSSNYFLWKDSVISTVKISLTFENIVLLISITYLYPTQFNLIQPSHCHRHYPWQYTQRICKNIVFIVYTHTMHVYNNWCVYINEPVVYNIKTFHISHKDLTQKHYLICYLFFNHHL